MKKLLLSLVLLPVLSFGQSFEVGGNAGLCHSLKSRLVPFTSRPANSSFTYGATLSLATKRMHYSVGYNIINSGGIDPVSRHVYSYRPYSTPGYMAMLGADYIIRLGTGTGFGTGIFTGRFYSDDKFEYTAPVSNYQTTTWYSHRGILAGINTEFNQRLFRRLSLKVSVKAFKSFDKVYMRFKHPAGGGYDTYFDHRTYMSYTGGLYYSINTVYKKKSKTENSASHE